MRGGKGFRRLSECSLARVYSLVPRGCEDAIEVPSLQLQLLAISPDELAAVPVLRPT